MKFLMIDNSRSVYAFLKLIVEDLAFDWVNSVEEGIKLLNNGGYDILFFEWSIDDRDKLLDFDSSSSLRKIALAASVKKQILEKMVEARVDGFISKPFTKERFNDCILNNRRTQPIESKSDEGQEEGTSRLRILYCEDDPNLRELVQSEFEDLGDYDVSFADDGEQGNKLLQENKFDALITDINMPKLNGIDLIKSTRQSTLNSHTPIFIFSGEVDPNVEDFSKKNVIDIFYKPFDIQDILEEIHNKVFPSGVVPSYHSSVVDYWYESINEVLTANVGDCGFGTIQIVEKDLFQGYISSSIGMVGPQIKGRIHVVCDHHFCMDYLNHLFGEEKDSHMNDLQLYLGELANQLAGRLKLKLERHDINLQITVPETHFGKENLSEERKEQKILLVKVNSIHGAANLFLSLSKIGDEVFRNKTKNVVLDGGLFF